MSSPDNPREALQLAGTDGILTAAQEQAVRSAITAPVADLDEQTWQQMLEVTWSTVDSVDDGAGAADTGLDETSTTTSWSDADDPLDFPAMLTDNAPLVEYGEPDLEPDMDFDV